MEGGFLADSTPDALSPPYVTLWKEKNMKKRIQFITKVVLVLGVLGLWLASCGQAKAPTTEIIIYHTNDMHGRVLGDDEYVIGMDRIAAIHKATENAILVDAGDSLHGLPMATASRGADIVSLMNAAGYAAFVPGNHDFNYGYDRLVELRQMADFPFLAANIEKNASPALDEATIMEIDGVKIGVFGLTTTETAELAMPQYVAGLVFTDPAVAARKQTAALRSEGAHVVIALCHMGLDADRCMTTPELVKEAPDIDVIIDGHSHTVLPDGLWVDDTLIVQAGSLGAYLGQVTIGLEKGQVVAREAALIDFEAAQNVSPDPEVAAMLSALTADLDVLLAEVIGESRVHMSSERAPGVRTQEEALASLIADAYRMAADSEIAVINGGDIRADMPLGAVTKGDVVSILPFGNTLMVKAISPALLKAVLENGVSGIVVDADGGIDHEASAQGRFLNVSGFSFTYDPGAAVGERVLSISLDDGRQLSLDDDKTQIMMAASNYIMSGGDYYDMLADIPVSRELGAADEALAAYMAAHSPFDAPQPGRVVEQTPTR